LKHLIESTYTFSINEVIHMVVAFSVQRVLSHHEDQALLKAYIAEWRKFFTQCDYLPTPFRQLESSLAGKTVSVQKKAQNDESIVRKV
jgi:cullin-5